MDSYTLVLTSIKTYIHQLSEDTGCGLDSLP